jgi:hypothetical protein
MQNRRRESLFFVAMAVAMARIVVVGFARSFFLSFLWREHDPHASSEAVYYVQGSLAASWMAFAVAQPVLISNRRVQWHRKVGWVGAGFAPAAFF